MRKPMVPFLPRLAGFIALALGLMPVGACLPAMQALAPQNRIEAVPIPIVMVAVGGVPAQEAQRFAAVFNAEAQSRGFQLAQFADTPSAARLTMMLNPAPMADGRQALLWVMQVSNDGQTRSARLNGAELIAAAPNQALDEQVSRKISAQALADLSALMRPDPVSEPTRSLDPTPEE
jgi:hypothetical protein